MTRIESNKPVDGTRISRQSRLEWIPVADTVVSPMAQRALRPAFVDKLVRDFDPEHLGYPVVNYRDGLYYIIDGQHRIAAIKLYGWGDQKIQCECFRGLSESEEAHEFLKRQQRISVLPIDAFRVAITAGEPLECDIDRIVRAQGLCVGGGKIGEGGSILAVRQLVRIYEQGGSVILGRTLRIVRDAFGERGLSTHVIGGMGLVCVRYQDQIREPEAIAALQTVMGGANGLLGKATHLKNQSGRPAAWCVASTIVDYLNVGRRGRNRLKSWDQKVAEEGDDE